MKFIAVAIFSFLLIIQTFSKWLVIMEYAINKEYIAKNLCVNRSKPKLHCNGKCQLMKKMAAEEDQSNTNSSGSAIAKISISEVLFNDELTAINFQAPLVNSAPFYSYYLLKNYASPLSSVFHPPLV